MCATCTDEAAIETSAANLVEPAAAGCVFKHLFIHSIVHYSI